MAGMDCHHVRKLALVYPYFYFKCRLCKTCHHGSPDKQLRSEFGMLGQVKLVTRFQLPRVLSEELLLLHVNARF